ncbi:MAG: type I glutamate--ammonia ligase [Chloroflexota bacterium]|nr:type I glutamate--ammonia ligase [Chloroflexota bacterium]
MVQELEARVNGFHGRIEPKRVWTPESAGNKPSAVSDILARAEKEKIRFVNLQFTDLMGIVKSVAIPLHQFEDACVNGKWFDGSSIEGFARIAESDMFLVPDLSTWAVMPWERTEESTARAICWVYNPNGDLFEGDPRHVLARALDYAAALGYKLNTGPELEFFLFRMVNGKPTEETHDMGGYFDLTGDMGADVRKDMVNALEGMGIKVETSHHEVARGQHEIDFEYAHALTTADSAVTLKYTLKAIAARHGLHCTFMPKPIFGINGSGMHTHQSLAGLDDPTNKFADADDPYGLSPIAKQYIAGQLKHARGMCAVLAPLVNSYKRLVPGYEAPVYISWARTNRSALIRVPKNRPGKPQAARVELRCPDPSANPYLAFAVMLRAGLEGIEKGYEAPDPVEENLYHFDESERVRRNIQTLPGSLDEALREMEKDELVRETLGDHITERLLEAKRAEWDDFRMRVTQWEIDRYLDIY